MSRPTHRKKRHMAQQEAPEMGVHVSEDSLTRRFVIDLSLAREIDDDTAEELLKELKDYAKTCVFPLNNEVVEEPEGFYHGKTSQHEHNYHYCDYCSALAND